MKSCSTCKNYQSNSICNLWGSLNTINFPDDLSNTVCYSFDSEVKINPLGIFHRFPGPISPQPYWNYSLEIMKYPEKSEVEYIQYTIDLLKYNSHYRPESILVGEIIRHGEISVPL